MAAFIFQLRAVSSVPVEEYKKGGKLSYVRRFYSTLMAVINIYWNV